ncbi:MAG TPA: metalloregulator ArsR/SmtB family transcription factor [Candidatus Saccharimonadales bacterium]|nr:metalloregulator ArsR/SmtB family transcription factor [Candidatus Saccharimonadales bacterium]
MLTPAERVRLKKIVSEDNQRLAEVFDTIGDANRCQLFRLVARSHRLNVTEAAKVLRLSVPLASQHLKILEKNGLLIRHKLGREVFYGINQTDSLVTAIVKVIQS